MTDAAEPSKIDTTVFHITTRRSGALCGCLKTPVSAWPEGIKHVDAMQLRKGRVEVRDEELCKDCFAVFNGQGV